MTTRNVNEARANLYKLIDDTSVSHEPVVIAGKRGNAVLLALYTLSQVRLYT